MWKDTLWLTKHSIRQSIWQLVINVAIFFYFLGFALYVFPWSSFEKQTAYPFGMFFFSWFLIFLLTFPFNVKKVHFSFSEIKKSPIQQENQFYRSFPIHWESIVYSRYFLSLFVMGIYWIGAIPLLLIVNDQKDLLILLKTGWILTALSLVLVSICILVEMLYTFRVYILISGVVFTILAILSVILQQFFHIHVWLSLHYLAQTSSWFSLLFVFMISLGISFWIISRCTQILKRI